MLRQPTGSSTSSWHPMPDGADKAYVWKSAGSDKIEVAVAEFPEAPAPGQLAELWARRQGRTPVALLLVWVEPQGVHLCFGIASDDKPVVSKCLPPTSASEVVALALGSPNHERAASDVVEALVELDSTIPGLSNGGLLATHHLNTDVRGRSDWAQAKTAAAPLLTKRGKELIRGLGFKIEARPESGLMILKAPDGERRAMAVVVDLGDREKRLLDAAFHAAVETQVSWIIALSRHRLRIYPAKADVGVAGRGPLETYIEVNTAVLDPEDAAYLWLLFSSDALAADGSLSQILAEAVRFAVDLGARLRERIYHGTVSHLVDAVVEARTSGGVKVKSKDLQGIYEQALTFLFRLLFIAYAEDRDLLPVTTSAAYREASLTSLAMKLLRNEPTPDLSSRLNSLFEAVDKGRPEWGVPAYNGGLFSSDPSKNRSGAALSALKLPDGHLRLALEGLLVDADGEERGTVDFRSLKVREFGTIYEGLLESELSIALSDLTVSRKGEYEKTADGQPPTVKKDAVYLHNKSGARKAAGAYFTPAFAVDHLLDHSLEPALSEHAQRVSGLVEAGRRAEAEAAFFDFTCADLSMGSGHFLVAAADRIAAKLSVLHGRHNLPGVAAKLDTLRQAAEASTGVRQQLTDLSLIRRIVARRCVYGADINPMSAELTRLSLWIHTFIPGLPMSYLGHNLRSGNSLTGVGTFAELKDLLDSPPVPGRRGKRSASLSASLFGSAVRETLSQVSGSLLQAAALDDATVAGVHEIEDQLSQIRLKSADTKALCDILVALRAGRIDSPDWTRPLETVVASHGQAAAEFADEISALHFPVVWPEVFSPAGDGFDVCIGNPPWEKLIVEEHAFWARYRPGLRGRSLTTAERERETARLVASNPHLVKLLEKEKAAADAARQVIMSGPYPGLGSAHPDLYQAFCWRNWQCVSPEGRIGMVLPRGALSGSGAAEWRSEVYDRGEFADVAVLTNNKQWVFNIHPQFTVALVSIRKGAQGGVRLRGPFRSLAEFSSGVERPASSIPAPEFRRFASGGAFPQLPSSEATGIYRQMRLSPRFDSPELPWVASPVQGDMNATTHKPLFGQKSESSLPVWAGKNFNRWQPEVKDVEPYAWAEPTVAGKFISDRDKKRTAKKNAASNEASATGADVPKLFLADPSAEGGVADEKAAIATPSVRVAFRCITNATNRRTFIAAAIPAARYLQHSAGFLRFEKGGPTEQAALLGVLCSTTLDWFARRIVESGLTFEVLNSLPVPLLGEHQQRVAHIAGLRTARADDRLNDWAEAAGTDLTETTSDTDLDVELDAIVAHAYGLTEEHLDTIWATYGPGADALPDLAAVKARLALLRATGGA